MKVLVVTSMPDAHVEMVTRYFDGEFQIFDPYLFPYKNDITYEWLGHQFHIFSGGERLDDAQVVWFRKPTLLDEAALPVQKRYRKFALDAYRSTIIALYGLMSDSYWVSDYWAIQRSSNKLLQLETAYKLGLLIPDTLVTSVPEKAYDFIRKKGRVVAKTANGSTVSHNGIEYGMYTTLLHAEDALDLTGLPVAPAIFQKAVNKVQDVRVSVIGDQIFACCINQPDRVEEEIDWRKLEIDQLQFSTYDLPADIAKACIEMVSQFGLKFGALDFVKDGDGKLWFLELNPNGQWGFVQERAGLPLAEAFAKLFRERP